MAQLLQLGDWRKTQCFVVSGGPLEPLPRVAAVFRAARGSCPKGNAASERVEVKHSKAAAVVAGSLAMLGAAAPAFAETGPAGLPLVKSASKALSGDAVGHLASNSQLGTMDPLVGQVKRVLNKTSPDEAVKAVKVVSPLGGLPAGAPIGG
jgi:hypothetical protein